MERFENHEYLLSGALDKSLSSAEADAFAALLQSSPALQREYADLCNVENMLFLHAHAQTTETAAFREDVRSQLRSSLLSSVHGKNHSSNIFGVVTFMLLLSAGVLWWQYPSSSADTVSANPVSSSVENPSVAQEKSIPSAQQSSRPVQSSPTGNTQPLAHTEQNDISTHSKEYEDAPAPSQPSDSLAGKIENRDTEQLRRFIESTTLNVQAYLQNGNLYAAATDAKRTALLYEKTGDISNARSWFLKSLAYAHESGIKEQEAEISGEAALFESRHHQFAKAKELRERCMKLFDNTSAQRTRWEEALQHIP